MGEESAQLRREIEQTRERLGTDVDALSEKVSPTKAVGRQVDRAKDTVSGLKDRVMGTTSDVTSSTGHGLQSAASSASDAAGSAASTVSDAAGSATSTVRTTRGVSPAANRWR